MPEAVWPWTAPTRLDPCNHFGPDPRVSLNFYGTASQLIMRALCAGEGYDREAVFHYAEQVAAGFRQPMPPHWPQKIRALIADCWHQVLQGLELKAEASYSVVAARVIFWVRVMS